MTSSSWTTISSPTLGKLGRAALPFSLNASEKPDRNVHTAKAEGALDLFVENESVKGYYHVAFPVPGADVGTPGDMGFSPGGPRRFGPSGPRPPGGPGGPTPGFDANGAHSPR